MGSSASSAGAGFTVLSPGREHLRTTYNDLAGQWWTWAGQFPREGNPILENGQVDCSRGRSGKVWFLAGTFGGALGETNPADRTCTIPAGKALFIPMANSLYWVPDDGTTVDEVRQKANADIDAISQLTATIDEEAVEDPFAYRAQSPPGGFALPFGPLIASFGYSPDPDPRQPAVADGYWLLIAPLPRGTHEIEVHAGNGATLNIGVTYHLTVGRAR